MRLKNTKTIYLLVFAIITGFLGLLGWGFSALEVNTSLNILTPPYTIDYTPPYITGQNISGYQRVSVTGDGIRPNITGIWNNGTYTFEFYRGTGPFTTGAGYTSGNTRTLLKTKKTIDRIDNTPPIFSGVTAGTTYNTPITITFADNLSGVTATLNGSPFMNGTTISTNGTYQLIVTDAVGNRTGATFIMYLAGTPSPNGGGGTVGIYPDLCTLPSTVSCANSEGKDYSSSYYDNTCCFVPDGGTALGARLLTENVCKMRNCYSSYYTSLCGPCTPSTTPTLPDDRPPYHYTTPDTPIVEGTSYPQERITAYQWAYRLGITTAPTIKDANLEGVLYRKIAAKMASEFAMNVVGLVPDMTRICEFSDIDQEIPELQYYMKLSCQLGIMGLDYYGDPDTVFNPNHFVTRDQFVTILSRILFRGDYNLKRDELTFLDKAKNFAVHTLNNIAKALKLNLEINTRLDRYTKHLEVIKKLGIMTDYTISLKEFKIYVILIMYRLDQLGIEYVQKLAL